MEKAPRTGLTALDWVVIVAASVALILAVVQLVQDKKTTAEE